MHPNSEMEVAVVLTLLLQVIILCLLITLNKKVTALKQKVSNLSAKSKSLTLKPAIPTRFKDGKTTTNPDSVSQFYHWRARGKEIVWRMNLTATVEPYHHNHHQTRHIVLSLM